MELSECCQAKVKTRGDDEEGTHYYVCTECDKACDVLTELSLLWE